MSKYTAGDVLEVRSSFLWQESSVLMVATPVKKNKHEIWYDKNGKWMAGDLPIYFSPNELGWYGKVESELELALLLSSEQLRKRSELQTAQVGS